MSESWALQRQTRSGSRALTIQGVAFHRAGEETEIAGSKILERKYAGYSQGTCYQFRLVLAADESPDPDGFTKKADMIKIIKTRGCCGQSHAVDAVPHLISAQAIDRFLLGDTIATAQSCHAINFRECA